MSVGSKKSDDNFEKMKREMTAKKRKAEKRQEQKGLQSDVTLHEESNEVVIEHSSRDMDSSKEKKKVEQDLTKDLGNSEKRTGSLKKIQENVVFQVADEEYALGLSNIKEIMRIPPLIKIPQTPQHIIGMCSLRGELLPVIDCRELFGLPLQDYSENSRIVVVEIQEQKAGLLVDKVLEVIRMDESLVKVPPNSIQEADEGVISGLLILKEGKRVVMILDATKMMKEGQPRETKEQDGALLQRIAREEEQVLEEEQIVVCNIGSEEYGLSTSCVKEIVRMPDIIKVPSCKNHIEGVFSIRNQLLAVINLGKLLGVKSRQIDETSRVIIVNVEGFSFGVTVDKVSQVLSVRKELCKEDSQMEYGSSSNYIKRMLGLDNGKRVIMMLDPHKLISEEEAKLAISGDQLMKTNAFKELTEEDHKLIHFVIFKVDNEEYAIKVNHIQEINRVNEITSFPGAPEYIAGLIELRGNMIPLMNLRRLFGFSDLNNYYDSKFLVIEFKNKKIGILIDSASEVRKIPLSALEDTQELFDGKNQFSYIEKIAKINEGKRSILMLNLSALLSFL